MGKGAPRRAAGRGAGKGPRRSFGGGGEEGAEPSRRGRRGGRRGEDGDDRLDDASGFGPVYSSADDPFGEKKGDLGDFVFDERNEEHMKMVPRRREPSRSPHSSLSSSTTTTSSSTTSCASSSSSSCPSWSPALALP